MIDSILLEQKTSMMSSASAASSPSKSPPPTSLSAALSVNSCPAPYPVSRLNFLLPHLAASAVSASRAAGDSNPLVPIALGSPVIPAASATSGKKFSPFSVDSLLSTKEKSKNNNNNDNDSDYEERRKRPAAAKGLLTSPKREEQEEEEEEESIDVCGEENPDTLDDSVIFQEHIKKPFFLFSFLF